MSTEHAFAGAVELARLISAKDISALELTRLFIDRIERLDGDVNAVVVRPFERALEDAKAADAALARGQRLGPLHGVPMTIKESYVMAGTPATWGIEAYRDNVAAKDGLAVQRFRAAGAHFLGKTNVPVDLSDIQSHNPIYGTTNNPWNLERTPGGSSGGSAAAVAAGFSALEAGSDIGGSIRTPAHFCGVYGHKPTWGIVPEAGHELVEGLPDPDVSVCGPLARSAEDLHVALDVMAGPMGRQAVGWRLDLPAADVPTLAGLRVALWPDDDMAPVSREIVDKAVMVGEALSRLGAQVSDTARPDIDLRKAHNVFRSLSGATMASGQPASRIAEIQRYVDTLDPADDSPPAVSARAAVMSHRDWIRHDFRREKLKRAWDAFFRDWDVVIAPLTTVTAIPHDHRPLDERTMRVDGVERPYWEHIFWAGWPNVACLPATAFPVGLSSEGLPIGLQAVCSSYRDHRAIEVARLIGQEIGGFTPPPAFVA